MPPTIDNVKVTALTAPTVAMVVTVVRIIERIRTKRWGVDDSFASLATAMLLVFVVGMFVHLGDPTNKTRTTAIALSYVLPQLFYGVLWSTRLSILFSIVRITPDYIMRRILYGLAVAFCVCWAILFSQVFWVCESQPLWKEAVIPQCPLGQDVAIAQLITDVFADLSLIAIPTKLLWNLRVSRSQRIRLLLTFSTSIITTIVSLVHAFYVLRVGGLEELIAAIVEVTVVSRTNIPITDGSIFTEFGIFNCVQLSCPRHCNHAVVQKRKHGRQHGENYFTGYSDWDRLVWYYFRATPTHTIPRHRQGIGCAKTYGRRLR
ncbi:hypothetical protein PTI98_010314 [Pleurotus ostreatus]|nr:hypothetical protein PTI98_010314 [Pleurotus ostreatus]